MAGSCGEKANVYRRRPTRRARREWDSNPRYGFPHTRFPSVRLKPLGHPSKAENFAGNIAAGPPVTTRDHAPSRLAKSEILAKAPRQQSPRRGTIPYAFRYRDRTTRRGEAGGRHGSWAIVMAPRHSAPNHHFDMGAWRPSRLILPSGSSVVSAYEGPAASRAFSLCASAAVRVILH